MKATSLIVFCSLVFIVVLPIKNNAQQLKSTRQNVETKKCTPVIRTVDNKIRTVGIDKFTLITDNIGRDTADADAIMQAKILTPLAMQKHDSMLFEKHLAKDFTSRGEKEFLDRSTFIQKRVQGKWTIYEVQYENMALEFLGDFALLTYRNIVKEIDKSGLPKTWLFSWADVWVKEKGQWKAHALRCIDVKEK